MFSFLIVAIFFAVIGASTNKGPYFLTLQRADFLKSFLPWFIILHHIGVPLGLKLLPFDVSIMGRFIVCLFFFISGYGLEFKRLQARGIPNVRESIRQALKRSKIILVPTIIPLIIYLVVLLLLKVDIVSTMKQNIGQAYYLLPYSWFVVTLLVLNFVFIVLSSLCSSWRKFCFFFCILTLCHILFGIIFKLKYYTYASDFAFIAGSIYKHYESKLNNKNIILPLIVGLLSCCAWNFIHINYIGQLFKLIVSPVFLMLSMFMLYSRISLPSFNFKPWKNISYEVYLCQGIGFVLARFLNLNYIYSFIVIYFTTFLTAWLSHKINMILWKKG